MSDGKLEPLISPLLGAVRAGILLQAGAVPDRPRYTSRCAQHLNGQGKWRAWATRAPRPNQLDTTQRVSALRKYAGSPVISARGQGAYELPDAVSPRLATFWQRYGEQRMPEGVDQSP